MIIVEKPGLYTSIQDAGRYWHRNFGVPVSGYMDQESARLANSILGNSSNDATIECTLLGPELRFLHNAFVAITGGDFQASCDGNPIERFKATQIEAGSVLKLKQTLDGARGYIAIKGGILEDSVLGSRSWYLPVTQRDRLKKMDSIQFDTDAQHPTEPHKEEKPGPINFGDIVIEVMEGPEFSKLDTKTKEKLLESDFTISNRYDRMGYQLNELVENNLPPIITSSVQPGTVQLTPSGKLIVLMRDAQTTGGYPRVLQLLPESINLLSQKYMGQKISFQLQADLQSF